MNIKPVEQSHPYDKVDCLVVGAFEDSKNKVQNASVLSTSDKSKLNSGLSKKDFKGSKAEALTVYGIPGTHEVVWVVGLGKKSAYSYEGARRLGSAIYKKAKSEKWKKCRIDFESISLKNDPTYGQSLTEGLLLSDYSFDKYKSKKSPAPFKIQSMEISFKGKSRLQAIQKAVDEAHATAEGVNWARTLGNEPANILYPDSYAKRIQKMARESKLKCQVFDEKKLATLKMGGILGVGQGSRRKPCLVILEHKPVRSKNKKPIVLVGKGITFDTGGISIKPSKAMEEMKFDMCGSAAVVGALKVVAKLKLPLHIIGITPLAENMPGGEAQRPGDVITCYNGKTVDVLNTDAEGRLVLADALAYSKNDKPQCVVDIATLTGACAYTLDYAGSGVMGNREDLIKRLKKAGDKVGERVWEFPFWEEYDEFIKGTCGDIQNISRKSAGIQTSAAFLKHFADHSPWAHLDIAGTAWTTTPRQYNPVGATGVGVRLFIEFLKGYL